MKTLYLVRHAKSSWHNSYLKDFDRPLNKRGEKDAPEMGRRLALMGINADVILASPANRAFTTASIISRKLNYPQTSIITDDAIFHADKSELMGILKKQAAHINGLMLFGHNPGFTDLANYLTDANLDNIPTSGVVAIHLEIDQWSSISEKSGKMIFFDYPKKEFRQKFLS